MSGRILIQFLYRNNYTRLVDYDLLVLNIIQRPAFLTRLTNAIYRQIRYCMSIIVS